jgi:hypothetical protein
MKGSSQGEFAERKVSVGEDFVLESDLLCRLSILIGRLIEDCQYSSVMPNVVPFISILLSSSSSRIPRQVSSAKHGATQVGSWIIIVDMFLLGVATQPKLTRRRLKCRADDEWRINFPN